MKNTAETFTDIRNELESTSNIAKTGRMFCYLYLYNHTEHGLCSKFGDTFVKAGEDANKEALNRISDQESVYGENHTILTVWDVSKYASKYKKNSEKAKIDTFIANKIGLDTYRVKSAETTGGADLYKMCPNDVKRMVQKELDSLNCGRIDCGLAEWQYQSVADTLDAKYNGNKVIVADLCARSGKTVYTGAVIVESGSPINIICSYVLTSQSSFESDLCTFTQFKNVEYINTAKDDWKDDVTTALKNGKQIAAFVSMCGSNEKDAPKIKKLKWLLSKGNSSNIFVDEADFGAWKQNMVKDAVKDDTFTVLMTGTNIERASLGYKIDSQITVSYIDMLVVKHENKS